MRLPSALAAWPCQAWLPVSSSARSRTSPPRRHRSRASSRVTDGDDVWPTGSRSRLPHPRRPPPRRSPLRRGRPRSISTHRSACLPHPSRRVVGLGLAHLGGGAGGLRWSSSPHWSLPVLERRARVTTDRPRDRSSMPASFADEAREWPSVLHRSSVVHRPVARGPSEYRRLPRSRIRPWGARFPSRDRVLGRRDGSVAAVPPSIRPPALSSCSNPRVVRVARYRFRG